MSDGLPPDFQEFCNSIMSKEDTIKFGQMLFEMAKQKNDFGQRIGIKGAMNEIREAFEDFIRNNPDPVKINQDENRKA